MRLMIAIIANEPTSQRAASQPASQSFLDEFPIILYRFSNGRRAGSQKSESNKKSLAINLCCLLA